MSKFCPECGAKQHDDNNRYCSNCGFDFSKLGDIAKSDGDDSSSKTSFESTKPKISQNSTNKPNQSSSQRTEVNHDSTANTKNNNGLGFLSNLSFNKCFFAFAALMIILVIVGMVSNVNQEPYSDGGLTSFMESSSHYDLNDFLEDSSYYDDYSDDSDDSDDYLMYGGDGESSRSKGSLI